MKVFGKGIKEERERRKELLLKLEKSTKTIEPAPTNVKAPENNDKEFPSKVLISLTVLGLGFTIFLLQSDFFSDRSK